MSAALSPPPYSDLPSYYDIHRRISPLDHPRLVSFTLRSKLQPYFIVPVWEFPIIPVPDWYNDSKLPGWNAGINDCNQTLKVLSSRQFNLIISHFIIISIIICLFFAAALGQFNLIKFENSRLIMPIIVCFLIIFCLLVSHALRKIFSLDPPLTTAKEKVADMGWDLINFTPKLGRIITPEIEIIRYELDLMQNSQISSN